MSGACNENCGKNAGKVIKKDSCYKHHAIGFYVRKRDSRCTIHTKKTYRMLQNMPEKGSYMKFYWLIEDLKEKFGKWEEAFESIGMKVNLWKAKVSER